MFVRNHWNQASKAYLQCHPSKLTVKKSVPNVEAALIVVGCAGSPSGRRPVEVVDAPGSEDDGEDVEDEVEAGPWKEE